ncbi:flavin reductase family protein [Acetobacter suratthaniensis]|uniref:Flavin reductase n=1 Tax=Acetobacter suratthaniensis TaxID=1502841 RepID=A0ABS3LP58_9PROT|nr:flavin reductase family protein [Acetobacter suratthaniensis]MBO1329151.1 flavin reductase [Acetobacter suratthaniensis]MCX2567218.1 flavin reductase family protein [Acetobacter suratthaniensis]
MSHTAGFQTDGATPPAQAFRDAMSRLIAPVALVTTSGPAGRHGLTVSALCSASAEPPSVLVCLNRDNRSHAAFVENGVVGISLLAPGDEALAMRFASSRITQEEKFSDNDWRESEGNPPVLVRAAAWLTGRVGAFYPAGSHDILLCHVQRIGLHAQDVAGLAWFGRDFHALPIPAEPVPA